jgi:hypothetical protein
MSRSFVYPWLGATSLALALWSCNGNGDPADVDAMPISPDCMEATQHSDLEWIQEKIFSPSCADFSACHQGNALGAAGLNLEPGMAAANMIGVPSTLPEGAGFDLVVPGDPENSYLAIILGQYDGPLPPSGTMPYNNPLLCPEKRDAIDRWILSLADAED